MTRKPKKTAALSGALLVRERDDSASGFVLSPTPEASQDAKDPEAHRPANDAEVSAEDPPRETQAEEVTPQHFLALLRQGKLIDAEAAFGRLTSLGPDRVQRALYGPGGRNLAIACRALGLEQLQFVSIFILTRKLGPDSGTINAYKLTETVNYFLDTSEETARRVLKQWQYESIEVFGHHHSSS